MNKVAASKSKRSGGSAARLSEVRATDDDTFPSAFDVTTLVHLVRESLAHLVKMVEDVSPVDGATSWECWRANGKVDKANAILGRATKHLVDIERQWHEGTRANAAAEIRPRKSGGRMRVPLPGSRVLLATAASICAATDQLERETTVTL